MAAAKKYLGSRAGNRREKKGSAGSAAADAARAAKDAAPRTVQTGIFDEAQAEILKIMRRDIFPRFLKAPITRGIAFARVNEEYKQIVQDGWVDLAPLM